MIRFIQPQIKELLLGIITIIKHLLTKNNVNMQRTYLNF
jgi:hypothetical protein